MPLAEKQTTKQKEEKRMGAEYSPPLISAAYRSAPAGNDGQAHTTGSYGTFH
jgi:hypothetical protein